jgi:hypothetical protein
LRFYPPELAAHPDADTTAVIHAMRLDQARLTARPAPTADALARVLARWRDLGQFRRTGPPALRPRSGVYLTWLTWPPGPDAINDADLCVNANALWALGKYGVLDTPGVDEATAWILRAVGNREHRDISSVALYYAGSTILERLVARAFSEGGVNRLAPTVERLADDLDRSAVHHPDATSSWKGEDTILSTACAVLTLLDAGKRGPLVDAGVRFLVGAQRRDGGWRSCWAQFMTSDSGVRLYARCDAFTTAFALEALCRWRLACGE